MSTNRPIVPPVPRGAGGDSETYQFLRNLRLVVNRLLDGRTNNTGQVTLATSATSTTVTDQRAGAGCQIFLMPKTANAAAFDVWLPDADITNGQFVLRHASSADTDLTYDYAIFG